jgi:hypothetical protein
MMAVRFYDDDGLLTNPGKFAKVAGGLAFLISLLAIVPATVLGFLSPMMCDGGCSKGAGIAIIGMMASPIFLMISMMAGFCTFKRPSAWFLLLAVGPILVCCRLLCISLKNRGGDE